MQPKIGLNRRIPTTKRMAEATGASPPVIHAPWCLRWNILGPVYLLFEFLARDNSAANVFGRKTLSIRQEERQ